MKRLKKYSIFISENLKSDIIEKINPERRDIKEFLIDKIIETVGEHDFKKVLNFIDDYLRDSEKTKINGLVTKSDVISFWEKFNSTIDEILSEIKFFEESPSELGSYSSYDYIRKSTEKSIKEILMDIKEDLESTEIV